MIHNERNRIILSFDGKMSNAWERKEKEIREDERRKTLEPFVDCEEDLIQLENRMENMYEEWSCFRKLSKLESMGIDIVVEGKHIVGHLIDKIEQMKGAAR